MLFENFLFAFFVLVIFLSVFSLIPAAGTGNFMATSTFDTTIALIVFSIVVIAIIKMPKKYYRPIPSRA